METDAKQKVWLNCYDISNGLAKQLSPMFLGKQIDGVWHTGLVVYGKEYFFVNGICCEEAGMTPFGEPTSCEDLGDTEVPQEMFHDFLLDIKDRFTFTTYNIVSNNCNHFTNECAVFLVDKPIPDFALKQAEEFFATPLGQQIQPLVIASQDALKQGSQSMFDTGTDEATEKKP